MGSQFFFQSPTDEARSCNSWMYYGFRIGELDNAFFEMCLPERLGTSDRPLVYYSDRAAQVCYEANRASFIIDRPGLLWMRQTVTYANLQISIHLEVENRSAEVFRNLNAMHCLSFKYNPYFQDDTYDRTYVGLGGQVVAAARLGRSRHPHYRMYLAETFQDAGDLYIARELDCLAEPRLSGNFCLRESVDGSWTAGMVCRRLAYVFLNCEYQCIHANPLLGDVAPGETAADTTHIVFHRGDAHLFMADMGAGCLSIEA